ncbi:mitochondrial carrier [Piedraia hortae CBS 480.64]|uniref:Mitochondrial carrier n=1 Tax=Piedraia hortae CBS 480.64 TaxID=1314780 RepID=A0A6A7CAL8_9PEZI|nr:mitochondrial carrier [Piedraia hortae CBS 480.64]
MSEAEGDTHNHGPPVFRTPAMKLAVWTSTLPDPSVNTIAGATAGLASGIATCPLDVIKTKLQAQNSFNHSHPQSPQGPTAVVYRGLVGTAKTIIHHDGLKGMYRGLGPMLLGYLPTWAVYMTVYESVKSSLYRRSYDQTSHGKILAQVYSSVAAGCSSTLATSPIWVIKTRLMSQSGSALDATRNPWHYTSTWDAARKIYTNEGPRAFYSGLSPALLGLTHVAIQFPLYEYFKKRFTGLEMGEMAQPDSETHNGMGILAATFLSKVCATVSTYPHEVLRTRLQTQRRRVLRMSNSDGLAHRPHYRGVIGTFRTIVREEGWRALYHGMGTNMVRAVPAAMMTMWSFETAKKAILKLQEKGREISQRR